MKVLVVMIILLLIFVIFLFIRKDKDQAVQSFSLGDFLQQNHTNHKETMITKINDFFDTDPDGDGQDELDDGDGGE